MVENAEMTLSARPENGRVRADLEAIDGLDVIGLCVMIEDKRAQPFAVNIGGNVIGTIVLATEHETTGRVLIIHALKCEPVARCDVTAEILAKATALARISGCVKIRCWTMRAGLVKKLAGSKTKIINVVEIDVGNQNG